MRVSVCIPVKSPEPYLGRAILALDPSLVEETLFERKGKLWEARRRLAGRAHCSLILNLDADTILPRGYLPKAVSLFDENPKLGAVALRYVPPHDHGHLAFGTSLLPKKIMLLFYDWTGGVPCECVHVWNTLLALGYAVKTVKDMVAEHRQ